MKENSRVKRLKAWLALSRLPFHSVGVLPFTLGFVVAWEESGTLNWAVTTWGVIGVVLVMLATYYGGEYWDWKEDSLSERSLFAGGSKVLQSGALPRSAALKASVTCALLAVAVGALLQFGYRTGVWTLPLGLLGLAAGVFYSAQPVRWVSRGFGELWIAFCYGWLPVAAGCYIQLQRIPEIVHWMAIPVGATIFNVILMNEFLDFDADTATSKRNLVVRFGRKRAVHVFVAASVTSWVGFSLAVLRGVPYRALWFFGPFAFVSLILVVLMFRGLWRRRSTVERMCGFNMAVNLGTTSALILAFLLSKG